MRSPKTLTLAIALWVASADRVEGQASCQVSEAARAVCAVEAKLTEALRLNDAARLSEIYADEFLLINYRGRQVDKNAVLAAIRSGALHFDSLSTSQLETRVYGEVALVTGVQRQVAREPGADTTAHPANVRFTHLYVLSDGRWRLTKSQITPIL